MAPAEAGVRDRADDGTIGSLSVRAGNPSDVPSSTVAWCAHAPGLKADPTNELFWPFDLRGTLFEPSYCLLLSLESSLNASDPKGILMKARVRHFDFGLGLVLASIQTHAYAATPCLQRPTNHLSLDPNRPTAVQPVALHRHALMTNLKTIL